MPTMGSQRKQQLRQQEAGDHVFLQFFEPRCLYVWRSKTQIPPTSRRLPQSRTRTGHFHTHLLSVSQPVYQQYAGHKGLIPNRMKQTSYTIGMLTIPRCQIPTPLSVTGRLVRSVSRLFFCSFSLVQRFPDFRAHQNYSAELDARRHTY